MTNRPDHDFEEFSLIRLQSQNSFKRKEALNILENEPPPNLVLVDLNARD